MNLVLTNHEKNVRIVNTVAMITLVGILVTLFALKSCQSDNGFRVEHSARMGGGEHLFPVFDSFGDTSKPSKVTTMTPPSQIKIVYHNYELKGSDTLFQILWRQILIPDDVTPRQNKALQQWLQTSIKIDSTK